MEDLTGEIIRLDQEIQKLLNECDQKYRSIIKEAEEKHSNIMDHYLKLLNQKKTEIEKKFRQELKMYAQNSKKEADRQVEKLKKSFEEKKDSLTYELFNTLKKEICR